MVIDKKDDQTRMYHDLFTTTLRTEAGDSGSIIVDDERRMVGLHTGVSADGRFDAAIANKFISALELISNYVIHKKRNGKYQ